MSILKILLNLPWSLMAITCAVLSAPHTIMVKNNALIVRVHGFWWYPVKGVRAMTLGNVVLLGKNIKKADLEHEMIHIGQTMREPLIHHLLSLYQTLKYGYKNNKYEQEAYMKAKNRYDA
jgi:hypothetical protein